MAIRQVLVLCLTASAALGQTGLDEALEGFEDDFPASIPDDVSDALEGFGPESVEGPAEADESGEPASWLRIDATFHQRVVVNFAHPAPRNGGIDQRGLSSLRSRINLEAGADLGRDWRVRVTGHSWFDFAYGVRGRHRYPSGFLDEYEYEAELGEVFIQGPLTPAIDLTLGRQIVVWGRSDHFRVTDVLNPLDIRLPGMTDVEDVRLPVAMVRTDYYTAPWTLSMIAIPERRFDKRPVFGSDFFSGSMALPPRDAPEKTFGVPELAAAATGTFPGWDISFHLASVFDDRPYIVGGNDTRRLRHKRIWMAGAAGNVVAGNWLLKAEAAAFRGLRYTNAAEKDFSRLAVLVGAEYSGFVDTNLAFEAFNAHILDYDDRLAELPDDRRRNEPATALRVSRSFRNDSIHVTFLAMTFGQTGQNGAIQRLQATYDWSDTVELTTGLVLYRSGGQVPFRGIGTNDRLFFNLDYHF